MRADGTFRHYRVDRAAMEAVLPLLGELRRQVARSGRHPRTRPGHRLARALGHRQHRCRSRPGDGVRLVRGRRALLGLARRTGDHRGRPVQHQLEWGTRVRGRYEVLAPPDLIAMRWDFDDGVTPCPAARLVGYLPVLRAQEDGCRVEVHQARGGRRAGGVPHRRLADGARQVQGVRRSRPAYAARPAAQAPRLTRRFVACAVPRRATFSGRPTRAPTLAG